MDIEIKIIDKQITLILKKDGKVIDELSWGENHNLSGELLVKIDELITRNNASRNEVKNVSVKTDMDDNFTTTRIVKVAAEAFNYVNEK